MAKTEKTIAKEIALLEKILKSKKTSATLREKVNSKIKRLKADARGIPMTAKQLANATLRQGKKIKELAKRDFNALIRRLSKKPDYAFLKGMSRAGILRDMARKAKPVGWRFKGRGDYRIPSKSDVKKGAGVYYEARPNRSDVSRSARLEHGGDISSDQAYYMSEQIISSLSEKNLLKGSETATRKAIEGALTSLGHFPYVAGTFEDSPVYAKHGGNVIKNKLEYFWTLEDYSEEWDSELSGLEKYLKLHLKAKPENILIMDNQGELEWELDVKLKPVPHSQWAPGIKTLESAEVKSAPGIVTFNDHGFDAVYFTEKSAKSFASIQHEEQWRAKGGSISSKWKKWSAKEILDFYGGEWGDYEVTDLWVNPKNPEEFYRIEKNDYDEITVLGELGDTGEELTEDYPTLAKARARARELVRKAESKNMAKGGIIKDKLDYIINLEDYSEEWDSELSGLEKYLKLHLKAKPENILIMDNQGELEWEYEDDVLKKLKRVPNSQWAPGIKTLESAEVKSAPGIVTFRDHGFYAVYFTLKSAKSFAFIQYEDSDTMAKGGNIPAKEKLADIVDKAFDQGMSWGEKIGKDNLTSGFYEWTSPKWIEGNVMTTRVDGSWEWAGEEEDEDGEMVESDGWWSNTKEYIEKSTAKLDKALKGKISKPSVIKETYDSGDTWYDGDKEIKHLVYVITTTFKSGK